jgi:NAD(P)-dependent dehydrogenase (short-subunit alcohol dehydrogenase family)
MTMSKVCEGRVVVVTGAGRGIGRAHAIEVARQGARVVVNDFGGALDGRPTSESPANDVVAEIRAAGGEAIASLEDVADFEGAKRLIDGAIAHFGRLDVLVNNAGFVRDRMLVSSGEEEWDSVIRVHLKGHFATARHAAAYWRDRAKAGDKLDARIVNTTSGAGLLGSVGQSCYSAAKAGIAALTLVQAAELGRYGVTVNAIAPAARTRMTEKVFADMMAKKDDGFDAMAPENVAPIVAWLASVESRGVTGQVFEVSGGKISVAEGWHEGPSIDKGSRWEPSELGSAVRDLLGKARPAIKPYGA